MARLPDFKDLPAFTASDMANPAGMVTKLQRVVETLQLIIGTRGPGKGNTAWFQSLVAAGLLDGGGNVIPTPPGSSDTTPPPVPSGLTVSPGINHIFVEWDAATYAQGGGNALSIIYGATYDPVVGGSLPTFGNAVPIATVPFSTQIYAHPTEPNVQWHIWVAFVTYADKEGLPAGGINGQQATSGKLDGAQHIEALTVTRALIADLAVDNAKIANLSAAKLITGSIAVGESISSSGFVSGFSGFSVNGAGNAEFNNAIFRGTGVFGGQIVATSGSIGGAIIGSNSVEASTYNGLGLGWRLDNGLGKIFAGKILISNVGATRIFDTDATGTSPVLKIGTSLELRANGDAFFGGVLTATSVVTTDNLVPDAATAIDGVSFSTTQTITSVSTGVYEKLEVGTLVFTTTGAKVQFDAQVFFSATINAVLGSCKIYPFIEMDGTELAAGQVRSVSSAGAGEDIAVGGNLPRQVSDIPRLLHTPSAGVHTYKYGIKVWRDAGGDTITGKAFAGSMIITELKR